MFRTHKTYALLVRSSVDVVLNTSYFLIRKILVFYCNILGIIALDSSSLNVNLWCIAKHAN